jgi:hypothetical protein
MDKITLSDSSAILNLLNDVALKGKGFCTECLLDHVLDAGFTAPDYLTADGDDPEAYFKGKPHAWAKYHIRQWKKVMMVYGGANEERRYQITETP